MQYFVDSKAASGGNGAEGTPFTTIGEAAKIAKPGDEVIVLPGIYREEVDPANGGTEKQRIVYRSKEKNQAVITGAEILDSWSPYKIGRAHV